jgi:hypothetical protein
MKMRGICNKKSEKRTSGHERLFRVQTQHVKLKGRRNLIDDDGKGFFEDFF